jgi:hypothetical protein
LLESSSDVAVLDSKRPDPTLPGGLGIFLAILGVLALVRIALGYVVVPTQWMASVNIVVTCLFLAGPILGLFFAANHRWNPKLAVGILIAGVAIQGTTIALLQQPGNAPIVVNLATAFGQIGLALWSVGLGALLGTMLKEKNLLLPVAIFLAIFDMFLVFSPVGPTQAIMKANPKVLPTIAAQIPSVADRPTGGIVQPSAFVGPADFIFLAMFFIAIFRFEMRSRPTLIWTIPTLLLYLAVVLIARIPLPALLPIGAVVLIVNWREFDLSRDEKLSTAVVAALGIALLIWGVTRPRPAPPVEPSSESASPKSQGSEGTPGPLVPN